MFEAFEDGFLDAPFQVDEPEAARAAPAGDAAALGSLADLGLDTTPGQLPPPDDDGAPGTACDSRWSKALTCLPLRRRCPSE